MERKPAIYLILLLSVTLFTACANSPHYTQANAADRHPAIASPDWAIVSFNGVDQVSLYKNSQTRAYLAQTEFHGFATDLVLVSDAHPDTYVRILA